ncbi:hypothetical protein AKJ09_07175 [Labilithrix luteola]|uniref:Substrate-specific component BioY of biotin ECF transporter n=1 Tax=Labilithrix luteola TaxID=1391654 RepID=A0A0K1Q4D0_9BACT|nr:hypothetical protein AKJ09_07175 [Labilithrix luteola]
MGATAVFAGRTMKPWAASALVIAAMFVGDAALSLLRGYPLVTAVTPFVYGGFVIQAAIGRFLRARKGGAIGAAVLGACVFFVLSNFGVWVGGHTYTHDLSGLTTCFVAAVPFFGGTLLGDVVWTMILSVAYRPLAARLAARPGWVSVPAAQISAL